MFFKPLSPLLALLIMGALAEQGRATVLTFEPLQGPVPDEYGDRVISSPDGLGYLYGEGDGFTPNVVVEYNPTNTTVPFAVYFVGYSDLIQSLGHLSFGVTGEVILRPDPGYSVILNSLEVGSWAADNIGSLVVLDGDGTVLFDSGSTTFPFASSTFFDFGGPLTSSSVIRIQLFNWGELSVDNIDFSQIPTVPSMHPIVLNALLPSLLMGAGLLAMRRRRNTAWPRPRSCTPRARQQETSWESSRPS